MKTVPENLSLGDIGGMGAVILPNAGEIGSGDVPAGQKKKKSKPKKLKHLLGFDNYIAGKETI